MKASTYDCDLLVIGSGAGALSAAVTARIKGLNVLVCEKMPNIGGATARSGGWMWIPGNRFMGNIDPDTERAAAKTYIRAHAKEYFDEARVEAYLENGPKMVAFMEANTHMRFIPVAGYPDYHPDMPGGAQSGRSIMPDAFDATVLGADRHRINPPLSVATWAGMMVSVPEMDMFQRAGRSVSAAFYVGKRLLRQAKDKLLHGVTMRLANGNALVGRMLATAQDLDLPVWTNAKGQELLFENSRVVGAVIIKDDKPITVRARRGVVIATGGFPHDPVRRKKLVAWAGDRAEPWMVMPFSNTGDGLNMAERIGGHVSNAVQAPTAMGPITPFDQPIGGLPAFPHLGGRSKPGIIAVLANGKRFVNEADSYHDFTIGLLEATKGKVPEAHIICDNSSIKCYGFGFAKPFPLPLGSYLKTGYLKKGNTLAELAAQIGVDPLALESTVATFNQSAIRGEDPEFNRGHDRFNTVQGDRDVSPNPCVRPLDQGPYYAVKVTAGSLGTFAGLATDENARVLTEDRQVIPGLYAVGNDMLSVLGGNYIGGGTTLGPGMTFGFIAGTHAAEAE